jgi:hypothetical protein
MPTSVIELHIVELVGFGVIASDVHPDFVTASDRHLADRPAQPATALMEFSSNCTKPFRA